MPNEFAADAGNQASHSAITGDAGHEADDFLLSAIDEEAAAQDAACDIEPDPESEVPGCFAELGNRGVRGLNKKVPSHLRSRRARQAPPRKRKRKWGQF